MSGAMWVASYFFYKKSYLNHDRYVIWIAAIFLSTKVFNEYQKIEHFWTGYHKVVNIGKGIIPPPPLDREEVSLCFFNLFRRKGLLMTK